MRAALTAENKARTASGLRAHSGCAGTSVILTVIRKRIKKQKAVKKG
jgi:hypothetical protein